MRLNEWTDYELLVACDAALIICGRQFEKTINRITESIVVKIGTYQDREYLNQTIAYRELQGTIC
jgi:hypothetical protein